MTAPALTDTLLELAARDPARPFCVHYAQKQAETVTWGGLRDRAAAVAGALRAMGCGTGDVALLFIQHHPDIYAVFVGCMLNGTAPALMPYPNPKQDSALFWASHRTLLARIEPRLLIVSEALAQSFAENLPEFASRICPAELLTAGPPIVLTPGAAAEIAFLQHSSGTTASKKGVMLSHAEVLAQVASYQAAIGMTERDVTASWLPLYHDMGLISCFMMTLVTGSTLVALDPFEWVGAPTALLEVIERHRATLCWMPNFAFNHLVNTTRLGTVRDLSSLRALINCSEPCKAETFERFAARFAGDGIQPGQLQVCYAMAENVFAVTQTRLGVAPRTFAVDRAIFETERRAIPGEGLCLLSCGSPVADVRLRIVGDDGVDLPDGSIGEIVIHSPFLFSGYYRQPEQTARALRESWYYSGDLGFVDAGELFVTGRKDDLLIAYGRNYYAHEVEGIASAVEGLIPGRCVAFAVPSEAAGTNLIVLVAETHTPEASGLGRRVRETVLATCGLALNQVELQAPGWLIKTTSGKISREANRRRFLEQR